MTTLNKEFKLMFIVASRPNFMKIAPLVKEVQKKKIKFSIFFTEQHKSELMTGVFAKELGIPNADYSLGLKKRIKKVSKYKKAWVLFKSILDAREIIKKDKPSLVVVVGDVVSSAYMTIIARNLGIPVAHVEAGLRSFNKEMPEERARRIIDRFSRFLFTHEETANKNLLKEGKKKEKIHFVGNIMIDSLKGNLKQAQKEKEYQKLKLKKGAYSVLTFHRHENMKRKKRVYALFKLLQEITEKIPVVYPMHPATKIQLIKYNMLKDFKEIKNLKILDPIPYNKMLNLTSNAKFVITDSGGLQEETTYLQIPCITLRTETERPVTFMVGTNTITGFDILKIRRVLKEIFENKYKKGRIPDLWDGKTAERIIKIIENEYNTKLGY